MAQHHEHFKDLPNHNQPDLAVASTLNLSTPAACHDLDDPSGDDPGPNEEGNELMQTAASDSYPGEETKGEAPELYYTLYERLGWLAMSVLITSYILILATLGFLWFVWLADSSNKTWHEIAVRNWGSRTASLSAVLIRNAMSVQAGVATAMLAGLALERMQVLLLHLASVSTMRNAASGPYMLAWLLLKAFAKNPKRWRQCFVLCATLLLVITTFLSQFTSTALLADLAPGVIPGMNSSALTATNFVYDANGSIPSIYRGSVWSKKPPFYPVFAEYHEAPNDTIVGVSDTGRTLRAFLPLQDQQSRSLLREYTGRAAVVDSRVTCLQPGLKKERAHWAYNILGLTGEVSAAGFASQYFTCLVPFYLAKSTPTTEWQISMCQLTGFKNRSVAPVTSEFRTPKSNVSYGVAYLVANISSGSQSEWMHLVGTDTADQGDFRNAGSSPILYSGHNEWRNLWFTSNGSLAMNISLCYAALDTVTLDVHVSGGNNRTEPNPIYDVGSQSYVYDRIRRQFGQVDFDNMPLSLDERGVLALHKRASWFPGPEDYAKQPWMVDLADMGSYGKLGPTTTPNGITANYSAYLFNGDSSLATWNLYPRLGTDPSVSTLFQEFVQHGSSVAFAIQSLLTLFMGIMYYDQLQQFNDVNPTSQIQFVIVSRPNAFSGLTAVTAVIFVHEVLILTTICFFLFRSKISTVGNVWQTIAQILDGDAAVLLHGSDLKIDSKVEDMVKEERWKRRLVGIRPLKDHSGTELVHTDSPGGLARMIRKAPTRRKHLVVRRRVVQRQGP